jgi:thiosulfate dehydrogenase
LLRVDTLKKSLTRSLLTIKIISLLIGLVVLLSVVYLFMDWSKSSEEIVVEKQQTEAATLDSSLVNPWTAPSDWRMMREENKTEIEYGRELIAHTARYFGPRGSIKPLSNGMNCQNCHLKAGTQPWGNTYFAVRANYPKFRARSGTNENIYKRVNDCFERSLNGTALDTNSREMKAIVAYIHWVGQDVKKGNTPKGASIYKLKSLKRAIDPQLGKAVYEAKCQSCHQANGEGVLADDGKEYTYPPLWGSNSYNSGAGLYRMSNLAGYVKYNMPFGITYQNAQLTDEEAWDVAAYVNSMPRPSKDLSADWPDISKKPFDHPFGPFADSFTEEQHKFGPYKPIKDWYKKKDTIK